MAGTHDSLLFGNSSHSVVGSTGCAFSMSSITSTKGVLHNCFYSFQVFLMDRVIISDLFRRGELYMDPIYLPATEMKLSFCH